MSQDPNQPQYQNEPQDSNQTQATEKLGKKRGFFNAINGFFSAKWWSGASWLITLCTIHLVVAIIYLWLHCCYSGHEYLQLDKNQVQLVNGILALYPDSEKPTSVLQKNSQSGYPVKSGTLTPEKLCDSISALRENRDDALIKLLNKELDGKVDDAQLKELASLLKEFSAKDAGTIIGQQKFLIHSCFWLTGCAAYIEVLLWAFIGVLTSMIYYVSIAHMQKLKTGGDADSGSFDPNEISGQVAKMFYAPVTTLVIVLGYNYVSSANTSMADISSGKGLILFCFIAGFFSGRLMAFLDGIKKTILPVSQNPYTATTTPNAADTTQQTAITLQLQSSVALTATGATLQTTTYNTAKVSLVDSTGKTIYLSRAATDAAGLFTAAAIPYGNYTAQANLAYTDASSSTINLSGKMNITVSGNNKTFTLSMDKV